MLEIYAVQLPVNCRCIKSRKAPPSFFDERFSNVPSSITTPSFSTAIRSAVLIVDSRCAIEMTCEKEQGGERGREKKRERKRKEEEERNTVRYRRE